MAIPSPPPTSPPPANAAISDPSGTAWLLRRAISSVDAELPSSTMWSRLRRTLLALVDLQAEWVVHEEGEATSVRAATVVAGARSVRFQTGDGSHLEPPIWGRDPSPESAEAVHRLRVVNKLAGIVRSQLAWVSAHSPADDDAPAGRLSFVQHSRELAAEPSPLRGGRRRVSSIPPPPLYASDGAAPTPATASTLLLPEAASLVASVRAAISSARAEAEALLLARSVSGPVSGGAADGAGWLRGGPGGDAPSSSIDRAFTERARARARSAAHLLDHECAMLCSHGRPMLLSLLSSLLSSSIRQQLRRILESDRRRNAKLLEQLPRGRRVGFLAKADSAAKVLSCALYEARQLGPMLREPTLRHLLTLDERDARDALAELPQPIIDDLLTLHESHAALRHLLCAAAGAPTQHEEGWLEVVRLVELARELACEDEAHFFPLADLASLRAVLLAQENSVPSLVRLLDWASPQYPLNQRTRARHSAPTPYKPGQPVDDASPSAAIDGVSEAISCA